MYVVHVQYMCEFMCLFSVLLCVFIVRASASLLY